MNRIILLLSISILLISRNSAKVDTTLNHYSYSDTVASTLNMDAVYSRPFLNLGKLPVAVGGYAEMNWQHIGTDGVSDGHQFQMRRLTIFLASTINKKIKFLTEIEFENGGADIAIEFASIDVEFHPLLNFRSGLVMNPIGAFNQNHDGPKWEFTDRPISATQMLPATWSNAGMGMFGKIYTNSWMIGYEAYLTGGFDNSIIDNEQNKTYLPSSKNNLERFDKINSGAPLFTGKIAVRKHQIGEFGFSYMGGIYNKFVHEGILIDKKRRINVFAIDYNNTFLKLRTHINMEWAWVGVQLPYDYLQQYGSRQQGGFVDIVQPIFGGRILGFDNALLNIACRLEYVDWNVGSFKETGYEIGEDLWSLNPAISLRPSSQTTFRLNYRIQRQRDIIGNAPSKSGGFNFGISSYF